MEKRNCKIKVKGCDASSIFTMELTKVEFELLKRVAQECNKASEYACMPTMKIKVTK